MPSPFPGMDPWLEGEMWLEFQATMCHSISEQLMAKIVPNYVALLSRRVVYGSPTGFMDAGQVVHEGRFPPLKVQVGAGEMVAEPTAEIYGYYQENVPHPCVEIRDVAKRRLVTVIEMLSPTTKTGVALEKYLEDRQSLLSAGTNLVEIDLLRHGKRLFPVQDQSPYFAYVSRFNRKMRLQMWAMGLREPLLTIPIPLSPNEDVALDLQEAFETAYGKSRYDLLLNYDEMPDSPAFSAEDQRWLQTQIKQQRTP